nr:hypothetical protein [uncultured Mucilaginibacter sp.]
MSNADIIAHFVSHKNVCGRIGADKLAAINFDLTVKSKRQFSWKGLIALATLSILFPIVDAKAQTTKVKHATAKKIASKEPLIFERAKERLSARAPVKIEIAVSPNGTVVPVKLDIKTEPAHTMLGGMVAGVKVSSVYEWWRDELIRIF